MSLSILPYQDDAMPVVHWVGMVIDHPNSFFADKELLEEIQEVAMD